MSKDEVTTAFDEWRKDALRDVAKMPNRWEAFYAGWQACVEFYENGGQNNERVFSKEQQQGRTDY